MSGITTASATLQPFCNLYLAPVVKANFNIGAPSSTLNASDTVTLSQKLICQVGNASPDITISALSGQLLLGQAFGISVDNQ